MPTSKAARITKRLSARRKQVNIRVENPLYQTLQVLARQDRRSVPQTALHLLESGLRQRVGADAEPDETPARQIAALAQAGRAFDWLSDEPESYDDTQGEPL